MASNKVGPKEVTGTGNMNVFLYHSDWHASFRGHNEPAFVFWALDSGTYAPKEIAGQSIAGLPGWDWIRHDQIEWYLKQSRMIERKHGKIPGFMFFHIPLWEFSFMWNFKDRHGVVGEKNEDVCPGAFNSGLFAAMLERADIRGVFCGHDHVNDYIGNYYGIYLGYAANTGFGTYGMGGDDNNRMRGARVVILREDTINTFETYMVYAKDYGIQ
jgi:hypothetical protein